MERERKLSIFIGSPKKGLEAVRQSLITAILEAGHIPCGMELWAAGSEPTLAAIERELKQCDIHVIVLGDRYGSRISPDGVSYTQWEYKQSAGIRPVIAFLLEEDN